MIDTIFYFVPTLEEYETKLGTGDIAPRTIVFVTDTRSIYKNGIRYGGYNSSELNDVIDGKLNPVIGSINNALQLIAALNDDLDDVIRDKLNEIQTIIDNTFSEYTWLKKNLGDVFAYSGFQDELNGFLTTVGVIKDSSAAWTSLLQTINSITGRVANVENGLLTEALIKAWIRDGVEAGIDLSTYALKTDLNNYLQTGNFSSTLEGTNAFVQLRSDVDGAKSAIGAWSLTYGNDSITQKLGALIVDVSNLNDSVTTTLTSTIRQYLGNDLQSGVDSYLQQQAGLILDSNLDSAVANLFASTTNTKTAVTGLMNAAGFIAESSLSGAAATQYATNGKDLNAAIKTYLEGDSSFISAIANNITIAGDRINITAAHQLNLSAQEITANNLNVVNNNKKVAYIDGTGHASFIDGHVYIPYQATNWLTNQEVSTVGLYVDSVAKESNDTTYATTNWSSLFHPRTLIEPDGLRFENSNKNLTGFAKFDAKYNSNNQIETYITKFAACDPNNVLNTCSITLSPAYEREIVGGVVHQSGNGYCQICNYAVGDTTYDSSNNVTARNWTGRFDINHWGAVVMEVSDEIAMYAYPNANNPGSGGISLHGDIRVYANDGNGIFTSDVGFGGSSDERKKDIIDNIDIPIENIAEARIVNFTWKTDENKTAHSGTIAQDWQNIIPNAVTTDPKDDSLYLDYGVVGTIAAVTAAKEIVALKEENRQLKERLARIEAALNIN